MNYLLPMRDGKRLFFNVFNASQQRLKAECCAARWSEI